LLLVGAEVVVMKVVVVGVRVDLELGRDYL
jgi:hypothetical protein